MKSPINIHPPKNWQDFETLCLKLWGEIWNIPHEIEFNSDNSQGQNGVDIYGSVDGGLKYNGIQCKNKKLNLIDGSPNRISSSDIQIEIDKAKEFKPALNKLIIATSLPKDQKIEEYIRLRSVDNVKNGLFSIQICFWDFFERKLLEFPEVYGWYVKNEDFHRVKSIDVKFVDGDSEIVLHPKFQKTFNRYVLKVKDDLLSVRGSKMLLSGMGQIDSDFYKNNLAEQLSNKSIINIFNRQRTKYPWEQLCWMQLNITNTGQTVIEDFLIELDFEGDFEEVGVESRNPIFYKNFSNSVKKYSDSKKSLYIEAKTKILVQQNYFTTGNFYIKPNPDESNIVKLKWKLLSRDFTETGELFINIVPKFNKVFIDYEVNNIEDVGEEILIEKIMRPGMYQINGLIFLDKEGDYNFE